MSVLIRGMTMPKAGQLLQVAENVDGTIFIRETTQGEWHQVVPVPTPHDRLIEAKYQGLLCFAPTVIEAEEREDE